MLVAFHYYFCIGNIPKIFELQLLKSTEFDGNEIRIMEAVAPKWKQVAIALGFNEARIEIIEMGSCYQPEDACLKMFSLWLAGGHNLKSPSWEVLIHSLRAANLTELANLLSCSTIAIVRFITATY